MRKDNGGMSEKSSYIISPIILTIISIVISFIALTNEITTTKLLLTTVFSIITLIASIITIPITKQIIKLGKIIEDKRSKVVKAVYYISLLPMSLLVSYIMYLIISTIYDIIKATNNTNLAFTISEALVYMMLITTVIIAIIIPYIQSLIILLLKNIKIKH